LLLLHSFSDAVSIHLASQIEGDLHMTIQLFAFDTPNGRKISVALEEMGLPYEVQVVDALPATVAGKVLRRLLKDPA